jgi:hypothetical protein
VSVDTAMTMRDYEGGEGGIKKVGRVGSQWIEGVRIGNPRDDQVVSHQKLEGGLEEDVELKLGSEYGRET